MRNVTEFNTEVRAALGKLSGDAQASNAAVALLNDHRDQLRKIATMPQNMKFRVQQLATADDELLESLHDLADTEATDTTTPADEHGQEQPGELSQAGALAAIEPKRRRRRKP